MAPPKSNQPGPLVGNTKSGGKRGADKSNETPSPSKTVAQSKEASAIRSVKFTSNRALEAVSPPDNTVEICGYIDAAERAKVVGKERKYTLIKFVLNNNCGKRIQCVAWQDQVERMKDIAQVNKIVRLNGAVAKKIDNPAYNVGNVSFELSVQEHTEVVDKGFYTEAENVTSHPELAEWDDVGEMEGHLIEIKGYLKMMFNKTKHKTGEAMYSVGAITNGQLKLAVRVTDSGQLPSDLKKGCVITVIGILHYDGNNPYVKVARGSDIKVMEGTPMDEDEMMEAACMPRKKVRTE